MNAFPASQFLVLFTFALAVLATVAGALLAVLATRIIRSVCGLALCCCGLAGLYYFLQSPFLTLMEILIYVGAICITIIFAVMLAEPDEAPSRETAGAALWWGGSGLAVSAGAFWGISHLSLNHHWTTDVARVNEGSVKDIGVSLLTTYSLAFELISVVLFVAIIGALVIAREGRHLSNRRRQPAAASKLTRPKEPVMQVSR
jgi:NADH:ubiquinone oxidoreductase subunit 6 (subunit J)